MLSNNQEKDVLPALCGKGMIAGFSLSEEALVLRDILPLSNHSTNKHKTK